MDTISNFLATFIALIADLRPFTFTEVGALQSKGGKVIAQINAAGLTHWREIGKGLALLMNGKLDEAMEEIDSVFRQLYEEVHGEAATERFRWLQACKAGLMTPDEAIKLMIAQEPLLALPEPSVVMPPAPPVQDMTRPDPWPLVPPLGGRTAAQVAAEESVPIGQQGLEPPLPEPIEPMSEVPQIPGMVSEPVEGLAPTAPPVIPGFTAAVKPE